MGWTRQSGNVVSLALLTSVVANYAIHRHFESQTRKLEAISQAECPGPLILDADSTGLSPSQPPRILAADDRDVDSAVRPALQTTDADDLPVSKEAPGQVPHPNDGVPITEHSESAGSKPETQNSKAVRAVIEDELAGSSPEERDIWYEELKSLPAGVVRDLLQVRKQLRQLPRALHRHDSVSPPRMVHVPAEQASQNRRPTQADWAPTIAAIDHACSMARHNLANSATPGFKRLRATLVDAYGSDPTSDLEQAKVTGEPARLNPIPIEGSRLSEVLLDTQQGVIHKTDRPYDLAIDGDGYFVAKRDDKLVYSRCGALILDADRRLSLAMSEGTALLDPIVTIPAEAREIQISSKGSVSAIVKPGEPPVVLGRLVLARFACPSRLRPIGGTLLCPTEGSGTAEPGEPDDGGRGVIQQGSLEQSNVEPEEELADIDQWQELLKSFPVSHRPVTASGQEPRSR